MKISDLEARIKRLPVPERGEDYWGAFPDQVVRELRRPARTSVARMSFSGFLWGGRLALTCLVLGLCLWQSGMPRAISHSLRADEKEFRQSMARIHTNLAHLMQDEHGLHKLVEDPS